MQYVLFVFMFPLCSCVLQSLYKHLKFEFDKNNQFVNKFIELDSIGFYSDDLLFVFVCVFYCCKLDIFVEIVMGKFLLVSNILQIMKIVSCM